MNFHTIKSIGEEYAEKILSAVSGFFTGCKRLDKRYPVSEGRRQRMHMKTEDEKWRREEVEKMTSWAVGKTERWKAKAWSFSRSDLLKFGRLN